MAGGGSGGGGTTSTHAEIAPELRPLFTGVGQQILAAQQANPLQNYAQWNPGQVAGIAPLQQMALNSIPSMTQAPPGLQALFDSSRGVNTAATGLYGVGGQNGVQQAALDSLTRSGRIGPMQLTNPAPSTDQFASQLPAAPQATLFPGAPAAPPNVTTAPTPMNTPAMPPGIALPNVDALVNQSIGTQVTPQLASIQNLLQQIQAAQAQPSPYYNG